VGKKNRKKKRKKGWITIKPDEVLNYGPIQIERYGKYIRFSNVSIPTEHAVFQKHAEEQDKKILEDLKNEVVTLQKLISAYGPVEIMHRATYMLLPLFMKYKSENEFDSQETYYLPAVEYLQYLIARTAMKIDGEKPSEEVWDKIWEEVLKILELTQSHLLFRKTLATSSPEINELRFIIDSRRFAIRVNRYPFFLTDYLRTSLEPYTQWIKKTYKISVTEIINELRRIDEYQMYGVLDRYGEVKSLSESFMHELREKGYRVDSGASPEEIEQTRQAAVSEEFGTMHEDLQEKMRLTFTPAIFDITDLTSLPKLFLSLLSVKPGESILTTLTGSDYDDLSPLSTSILHYKPFLEVNNRFYISYHSGFEDHIGEIIEADLFQQYPKQISKMSKKRSDYIESESKELLTSVIKPDFAFQNIYYPNPDDQDNYTELDALIGVDDILFLVEVKSGGFSEGAARGAPRNIEKELNDLIIEGQRQSERAEKYIKSVDEAAIFDKTCKNKVINIKNSDFRKIFRIIVTREELGWVGSKIAILSILDPDMNKSFPWHISIDDLRVVVELFKDNEIRFVHFLEQRLKASSETKLKQHDEIEHIALYNKRNYYHKLPVKGMDWMSYDPSYMRDIDYYFAEKSAGLTPQVPSQKIPVKVRDFINALKDSHLSGRFEAGSIVLSMDDAGRNEFQKALNTLDLKREEGIQRTFRIPFPKLSLGLSVSNTDDTHFKEELVISAAYMEQGKCKRWIVVQLVNEDPYIISKIEVIFPGRFSDEELIPGKSHLEEKTLQLIKTEKPGRNDPCPCGSGKKYKRCHGIIN
jgi:hypothetical protein